MAKYSREFLVPYLEDLCALHFAELEVCAKMFEIQREIIKLRHGRELEPPEQPDKIEAWDFFSVLCAIAGGFLMGASPIVLIAALLGQAGTMPIGMGVFLTMVSFGMGFFIWRLFVAPAIEASKYNDEAQQAYFKEKVLYKETKEKMEREDEELRKRIPALEKKLNFYSDERKKISKVLENAYAANVLPLQYRDIYAAIYLSDYFTNSRADDLDQVLNTYVLKQIKDKLDTIIENQRKSILNQRLMLANQQRALEEQRAHNEYMRKKACQIAASVEEQNQYLRMIECNSEATAYFAAANYLR